MLQTLCPSSLSKFCRWITVTFSSNTELVYWSEFVLISNDWNNWWIDYDRNGSFVCVNERERKK